MSGQLALACLVWAVEDGGSNDRCGKFSQFVVLSLAGVMTLSMYLPLSRPWSSHLRGWSSWLPLACWIFGVERVKQGPEGGLWRHMRGGHWEQEHVKRPHTISWSPHGEWDQLAIHALMIY